MTVWFCSGVGAASKCGCLDRTRSRSNLCALTEAPLNPRVSIIIVNWNGLHHLQDCFESLEDQSYKDFEAILVDNGSHDGSLEFVRTHYPWVRCLPLSKNTGFAAANNEGLLHANGVFIITLNNDTKADPSWLGSLVHVAEEHPQAGMVGSRICSFSEPDLIDSIGMGMCRDAMSRGHYRNKKWSTLQLPDVIDILFPSACAALYRREMLDQIGFFDEDFFAYAEDSDLGLRARLAGWQAVLATGAIMYHKYSQTCGSLSPLKVYLVERNHYWVGLKNFPWGNVLSIPLYTVLRYLVQLRIVISGQGTGTEFRAGESQAAIVTALLKAFRDSLAGVPRMLRKRRQVIASQRLTTREFNELLRQYHITFRELLDTE